jgi:phosphate transport system protein
MNGVLAHDLERLKQGILQLCDIVEDCVSKSVQALIKLDTELAQSVIRKDQEINRMEVEMEEDCLRVLALHQPVAIDLRLIVAIIKINNDLEGISDLASSVAKKTIVLSENDPVQAPFDCELMGKKVHSMLDMSIESFIKLDTDLAYEVLSLDDEVDSIHRNSHRRAQEILLKTPQAIYSLLNYLSVSRYLERIADLATNVAEDVIYLAKGDIVRHKPEFLNQ